MRTQSIRCLGRRVLWPAGVLGVAILLAALPRPALALITGGVGNEPVAQKDWPAGAAAIFDRPARVAWWEGPPFGGGQYHAECRGDAAEFNKVLADFAKLEVTTKRLVVHDGVGHSFWLDSNRAPEKAEAARIDWMFMVWNPDRWQHLRKMPAELNPTDMNDAKNGPPSQIDVYTGGDIRWADVVVPAGIEVLDQRLEAHGFTPADGKVVEGKVMDLVHNGSLLAKIRLEKSTPQPTGGYRQDVVAETTAGDQGHWVIKHVPPGPHRVVVELEGYVPRLAGYVRADDQPSWQSIDCGLSPASSVAGVVTDEAGAPLADVQVSLRDVIGEDGVAYQSPGEFSAKTNAAGRFAVEVPLGKGRVVVRKPGYCRPGLGEEVNLPAKPLSLQMKQSATVTVTVDFGGRKRTGDYIVNVEPEGGSYIGAWGGSASIDAKNQHTFRDVPPGRYTFERQPNPGAKREKTAPVTIELIGGEEHDVRLGAR